MAELWQTLSQVHPEYRYYSDSWRWPFWRDSYEGGRRFHDAGYLIQHPRETSSSWAFSYRKQFAAYRSYGRDVAIDWKSRLFGPGVAFNLQETDPRGPEAEFYRDLWADIDLLNHDGLAFAKKLVEVVFGVGMCGVFVDVTQLPDLNSPIVNLAQAERAGVRPYVRRVEPENILDWDWKPDGSLAWIKFRDRSGLGRTWSEPWGDQSIRAPDMDINWSDPNLTPAYKYRYFIVTDREVIRYSPTGEDRQFREERFDHNLERLPFVRFYWTEQGGCTMFMPPPIEEIYSFAHNIYQKRSGLSEIMQNQMFAILFMVGELAGKGQGQGKEPDKGQNEPFEIGTLRAVGLADGTGFAPFFASPDTNLVAAHLRGIEDDRATIRELARGVGTTRVDDKVRAASGRAHQYETDPLTTLLSGIGDTLEKPFTDLFNLIHLRSRYAKNDFRGWVKFPDELIMRGTLEEAQETNAICETLRLSPKACEITLRKFANSAISKVSTTEEMAEVISEISSGTPQYVESIERAMTGKPENLENQNGNGTGKSDIEPGNEGDGTDRDQEQPGPRLNLARNRAVA